MDNQARNARRLEEGERLNFMQDRFLNTELGTQFELLSSTLQDFRSDYDNMIENKNDGDDGDYGDNDDNNKRGDNNDNNGYEDIEDSDNEEVFSNTKRRGLKHTINFPRTPFGAIGHSYINWVIDKATMELYMHNYFKQEECAVNPKCWIIPSNLCDVIAIACEPTRVGTFTNYSWHGRQL